jgi:hypothetical protein
MVLDGIDVSKLRRVPRYTRISKENKESSSEGFVGDFGAQR